MGDPYLWIKSFHLMAVVSWMAGLFYLPRLFVYHAERRSSLYLSQTFEVMERRLMKAIMRPAAVAVVLSGVWLIWSGGWVEHMPAWLWVKLLSVSGLLAYHGLLEFHLARFAGGLEQRTGRYFRIINEIPTVLLAVIVILVVVKPF